MSTLHTVPVIRTSSGIAYNVLITGMWIYITKPHRYVPVCVYCSCRRAYIHMYNTLLQSIEGRFMKII